MPEIALASIDRLIRKAQQNSHTVSLQAVTKLRDILENLGTEIAQKAIELMQARNGKRLNEDDIILAAKIILKRDNL